MSQPKTKVKRAPARKRGSPWPVVMVAGGLLLIAMVIGGSLLFQSGQPTKDTGPGTPSLAIAEINSSPEAQIEGLKVDFGEMKLGAELATVTLTVANSGDKILNFSQAPYIQLADGCWPPKPVISSMTINPGESTTVSVEFSMHGDMGGPHDFRLHLPTNDPVQPDVVVTILSDWVD